MCILNISSIHKHGEHVCDEYTFADCFVVHTNGAAYIPTVLRTCEKSAARKKQRIPKSAEVSYSSYSFSVQEGTTAEQYD